MKFPRGPALIGAGVFLGGAGVVTFLYDRFLVALTGDIGIVSPHVPVAMLIIVPIFLGVSLFILGRWILVTEDDTLANARQSHGAMMGLGLLIAGTTGLCTLSGLNGDIADLVVLAVGLTFSFSGVTLFSAGLKALEKDDHGDPTDPAPDC